MPSLGADMEAGTLVEWLKKPGEPVKRGDVVAVVETQKGAIEIEIFEEGVLDRILVQPGEKVPVGTLMATLRSNGAPGTGACAAAAAARASAAAGAPSGAAAARAALPAPARAAPTGSAARDAALARPAAGRDSRARSEWWRPGPHDPCRAPARGRARP